LCSVDATEHNVMKDLLRNGGHYSSGSVDPGL
jgi:hypothetical protein